MRRVPGGEIRRGVSALGLALSLVAMTAGGPAQASPFVDITYDLDNSSAISIVKPLPTVELHTLSPPELSGNMKIRYASDSANGLVPGPTTLLTFNLSVHGTVGLTYATTGGATGQTVINTGTLRFHLTSPVAGGTLLSGGTVDPQDGIGLLRLTGTVHCYLLCNAIAAPVSTPTPLSTTTFPQLLKPLYGAFGSTVTGSQYAYFSFYMSTKRIPFAFPVNIAATTFLVGREVLREPVPEPSTLPLLAAGVGGLATLALGGRLARALR